MKTKSEDVYIEDVKVFGEQLGKTFNALKNRIFWLKIEWEEYCKLYRNKETIELLNKNAGFFFSMVQQIMIDDIILNIQKITSNKGGKFKYLTIKRLPDLVKKELKQTISNSINEIISISEITSDRRNRYIAHNSLDLVLNENAEKIREIPYDSIDLIIDLLTDLISFLHNNYYGHPIHSKVIYPLNNASVIISILKECNFKFA